MSYKIFKNWVGLDGQAAKIERTTYLGDGADDRIQGGRSHDTMKGNGGDDRLNGGAGNDVLAGGAGRDRLSGGAGQDKLNGGIGNDVLFGGAGSDTFIFKTALNAGTNVDTLRDFNGAQGDKIFLDYEIFKGLKGAAVPGSELGGSLVDLDLNESNFQIGKAAADADDRIVYDRETGQLFYDADGSGAGAAVLFARLNPGTILKAQYFYTEGQVL